MNSMRFARHIVVAAALTVTSLTQTTAPASAESTPQDIRDQTLASANAARAKYGARPLKWNDSLYTGADQWARQCKFQRGPGSHGENLFVTTAASDNRTTIKTAFESWMAEAAKYDYNRPGFSAATGGFTQVVWKNTTQITLAVARCPADTIFSVPSTYVVARFTRPGNYVGQFPQNVGRPVT